MTNDPVKFTHMRITRINSTGRVSLFFNKTMNFTTELANLIEESKNTALELLELTIIPGDAEIIDKAHLAFTWSVVSITSTMIEIKLDFEKPFEVSQRPQSDVLLVKARLSNYSGSKDEPLPLKAIS